MVMKVENSNLHQECNLRDNPPEATALEPACSKVSKSVPNVEIGPADQKLVFYAPIG
jgi:hypothetical protein